jgi:hypothetical protein
VTNNVDAKKVNKSQKVMKLLPYQISSDAVKVNILEGLPWCMVNGKKNVHIGLKVNSEASKAGHCIIPISAKRVSGCSHWW